MDESSEKKENEPQKDPQRDSEKTTEASTNESSTRRNSANTLTATTRQRYSFPVRRRGLPRRTWKVETKKDSSSSNLPALKTFIEFFDYVRFSCKADAVRERFTPEKDHKEMLLFLWCLAAFHKRELPLIPSKKNEAECSKFGNLGRQQFAQNKNFDALISYNKCIINAQPANSLLSEFFLSKGYANRSTILFKLRQYELCILDIDRAIEAGFPEHRQQALKDRKIAAASALSNLSASTPTTNGFLNGTSHQANLPEFNYLPECCINTPSSLHRFGQVFNIEYIKTPTLSDFHPKFPSIARSTNIGFSSTKGRYLYATEDIYPGEVILVEEAECCVPLKESLNLFCSYCLTRTLAPVPCPTCTDVVFCSEECREKGLESFHTIECPILKALFSICEEGSAICVLLVRFISQVPFKELRAEFAKSKKEKLEKGLDNIGMYSSVDYRTIFHLVDHKEKHEPHKLLQACYRVLLIIKLLAHEGSYMGRNVPLNYKLPLPRDYLELAEILLTLYMSFVINCHTQHLASFDPRGNYANFPYALMVSNFFSLLNHSCSPNAIKQDHGSTVVVKVVDFIPKGEEITISYTSTYYSMEQSKRVGYLKSNYYFDCNCDPCKYHWIPDLSRRLERSLLKCQKCNTYYDIGCSLCREREVRVQALFPVCPDTGIDAIASVLDDAYDTPIIYNSKTYYTILKALCFISYVKSPKAEFPEASVELALAKVVRKYIFSLGSHTHSSFRRQ